MIGTKSYEITQEMKKIKSQHKSEMEAMKSNLNSRETKLMKVINDLESQLINSNNDFAKLKNQFIYANIIYNQKITELNNDLEQEKLKNNQLEEKVKVLTNENEDFQWENISIRSTRIINDMKDI